MENDIIGLNDKMIYDFTILAWQVGFLSNFSCGRKTGSAVAFQGCS